MPTIRRPLPFLLLVMVLGLPGSVRAEEAGVEVTGQLTLQTTRGLPMAGVVVSAGGSARKTTDDRGRFTGLKVAVPQEGWVEVEAHKAGYGLVNALDLKRPWPSPLGRSFQLVMAPEVEVPDRAVLHWRSQLLQQVKRHQRKSETNNDEKTPQVAVYGEWLATVAKEKPSRAWLTALNLIMTGKPGEAVKALGPVDEPEEELRRQHLRVISALLIGDMKAARKELEAAGSGTSPEAWAQLMLGHLLTDMGEAGAAEKTLDALANRKDVPPATRARAVVGLAALRIKEGNLSTAGEGFDHADALFEEAAESGRLSFADEVRWVSLKRNLVVAALQVDNLPEKAKQQINPLMERHRALLARLPDAHEQDYIEALDFVANVHLTLKDNASAEQCIRERVAFHTEGAKSKPGEHLHLKAEALEQLGNLAVLQNDNTGALKHYTQAVEIVMGLSQPRESEGHLPLMCRLLRKQGALLLKTGQPAQAKTAFQMGVSMHQELNRVRSDHVPHLMERALCLQDLGNACFVLEETFAAAQAYQAAGQLNNRLVEKGVEEHRARAFVCLKNVSSITQKTGHSKESMAHALEALKHAERIEADHPNQHADLAEVSMLVGLWVLREEGKAEAKPHMERTVRLYRGLLKQDPQRYAIRLGLALCAEAQRVEADLAGQYLAEAEALLTKNPGDAQADLLRQTLQMTRKERGEVKL
jgi:tetratricopeptide (TPR) repeat protein